MRTDDRGQDECDWQERSVRRRLVSNWSTTIKSRVSVVFPDIPIYANFRHTPQYLVHMPHELSDNGQRIASRGNEGRSSARCVMGLAQSSAYTRSPDQDPPEITGHICSARSQFLTTTRATLT